jgi:putative SOS response-associated peptidase YedK
VCNLYSLNKNKNAVATLFRVAHNRTVHIDPLPGIFPNYTAAVVRMANDSEREMALMSWGFPLLQAGKAPRRVTNVRDDKILTSSFWRPSFEQRRCLVPATSFCEPNGDVKPATWHWFALKGDDPRPLFAFAGVWRRYNGPIKKDGPNIELEVYSFLTTTPNPLVEIINHERMPVLLSEPDEFETWLKGTPNEAMALARPYPAERLRIVQEGFDKEDRLAA